VDKHPLPVGRLVSALYRAYEGRPAIVVGGGPSAPAQLEQLRHLDAVVISANAHAWKLGLGAHYIACKDHKHTESKLEMEGLLRPYGVPIVSRHHWADYRLAQWPIQGNSGQIALGLAVLMGCRPVIPIGFDCYQSGTYFHDADAKNVSNGLRPTMWTMRYRRMAGKLEMSPIRVFPGPLRDAFLPLDAPLGPFHMPVSLQRYETMRTYFVRSLQPFSAKNDGNVTVPEGYTFPVDEAECRHYREAGCVEIVDSASVDMVRSRT
jgi:hypothetical protein